MTTKDLLEFHDKLCAECRVVVEKKNFDYAGASGQTPFSNFQASEQLGLCSTETGIVMRMLDKLKRLVTFCNAGQLKVENEGAADACKDIVNYAIILAAYVEEKRATAKPAMQSVDDFRREVSRMRLPGEPLWSPDGPLETKVA